MTDQQPRVGIGVIVMKAGKVLLGKRMGSHGAGEYAWPGGHLEYMESFAECAAREVMEETGMQIGPLRFCSCSTRDTTRPGTTSIWRSSPTG
jgi:8-oxo-dGTP diphosphatase